MGGGTYSHDAADRLYASRSTMPKAAFVDSTFTSKSAIDPGLDPKGVKLRESRDSAEHPESNAVAVFFDVTGSMGDIPITFAKEKLGNLMKMLLAQGVLPDPQILFGAVGDVFSDRAPLQVGQFESDLTMDTWLTKIFLEGNGGGQNRESYEVAMWWLATHTSIDCLEKRGKKGYAFFIGDEGYYNAVDRQAVKGFIGEDIEADIPIKTVLELLSAKYEAFRISVPSRSYRDGNHGMWKDLMGERAIWLETPDTICEFIAAQIAAMEGRTRDEIADGLRRAGLAAGAINTFEKSLVVGSAGTIAPVGALSGSLPDMAGTGKSITRL